MKILSYTTDLAVEDMIEAGAKGGITENFKKGEMDLAIKTFPVGKLIFQVK